MLRVVIIVICVSRYRISGRFASGLVLVYHHARFKQQQQQQQISEERGD